VTCRRCGPRRSSSGEPVLGRAGAPPHSAFDGDLPLPEVEVLPLERQGFAGPEAGPCEGQEEGSVPGFVLFSSSKERLEVLGREWAHLLVTLAHRERVDAPAPAPDPKLKARVRRDDPVLDGLREDDRERRPDEADAVLPEAARPHRREEVADVPAMDLSHPPCAEPREDVAVEAPRLLRSATVPLIDRQVRTASIPARIADLTATSESSSILPSGKRTQPAGVVATERPFSAFARRAACMRSVRMVLSCSAITAWILARRRLPLWFMS
jgi:hypothetical protein